MNPPHEFRFVKVDEETLIEFLRSAEKRILIAKAGYKCSEVKTLVDLVTKKRIECKVYLDPGEDAIRWGFGQEPALRELNRNCDLLNLQTAERIRMSIVIVDDRALIYTPVALAWETEPKELKFPNGFFGGAEFAEALIEQIGPSESYPPKIDNVIPFPGCRIPKKDIEETTKEISQTIERLEKNPPVDPTKLRKITVYRNNYKLLKYQEKGVKLKNKSVSLRPFNNLFPELDVRLKASWRAFTQQDIEKVGEIAVFLKEVGAILEKYTLYVGRFGYLIKTENKDKFEKDIDKEKGEFLDALKLKPGEKPKNKDSKYVRQPEVHPTLFGKKDREEKMSLGSLLGQSRSGLKEYMLKIIKDQPIAVEGLFANEETLFSMLKKNRVTLDDVLPGVLDTFINHKLRFPEAEELIEKMDVTVDYYDVSSELLHDNADFKEALQKLKSSTDPKDDLKIREFSDAFEQEGQKDS